MKYSQITGTMLNFKTGERHETGTSFSSHEENTEKHIIIIRTFDNRRISETTLLLEAPDFLAFHSRSADPRMPVMTGRFWNSDHEECVLKATLSDQNIKIDGVVTKLDQTSALSTKTMTDHSGSTVAIMQERVKLISETEFKRATSHE